MVNKPTFINILRMWLGLIGVVGVLNTFPCFFNGSYLYHRLYTADPDNVTGLTARLFGVWTMLSATLRFLCALNITNKTIYSLTLFSFVLAIVHFLSEVFIYRTAIIQTAGIVAPLIVTVVSITLMTLGYFLIDESDPRAVIMDENREILCGRARKKLR